MNKIKKILSALISVGILAVMLVPVYATELTPENIKGNVPTTSHVSPTMGTIYIPASVTATSTGGGINLSHADTTSHTYEGEYWVGVKGCNLGNYGQLTIKNDGLVMENENGTKATASVTQDITKFSTREDGNGYLKFGDRIVNGNITVTFSEKGTYSGVLKFHLNCEELD